MADNNNNNNNKSKIDNLVNDAIKSAKTTVKKKVSEEKKAISKAIKEYDTKEAAKKIVNSALDKMIDDAVKKAKKDDKKNAEELNKAIKEIVRGHKNAYFNAEKLIDAAAEDAKIQLDFLIERQVKEVINTNYLNQALQPLKAALYQNVNVKLNTELTKIVRLDVTKELDIAIGEIIKDPLKDINVTLNKLHLSGLSKELNKQVANIQTKVATDLTVNITDDVAIEQEKVAKVQERVAEMLKQAAAFEQTIKDKIQKLQEKAIEKLKELEDKLIEKLKNSIKIKL